MNNNFVENPIFICGYPKSGTTLLISILDQHPQLVVYPIETSFFRSFLPVVQKNTYEEKVSLAGSFLFRFFDLFNFNIDKYLDFSPEDRMYILAAKMIQKYKKRINEIEYRHDGDLLRIAIQIFGEEFNLISDESLYWVEKTPHNEYYADKIFEWWPNAHCIHIVRDPRDNFSSFERKQPDLTVERFSNNWRKSIMKGFSNQAKFGKDRYLIIKYEELVQNFEETLREIIDSLGINYNDILKIPTQIGQLWKGNSMFNDSFSEISSNPIGRSKKLPESIIRFIETFNSSLMKKLSYKPQYSISIKDYIKLFKSGLKKIF